MVLLTRCQGFRYNIDETGTREWSPISLSREFDDWTRPVSCELAINEEVLGSVTGATIGVTSAATQTAALYALSSTRPYDPVTTPSATPTPSSISGLGTGPSSALPTATPTGPTITGTSDNSGLSTGAKAGIGAGVAVGALLVAAAAYMFYRNHRKMKALNARVSQQSETQEYSKPAGVAVAHHAGDGYNRPYSDAPTWSQGHQSPEVPPQELVGIR
jgi:hypothetical protein